MARHTMHACWLALLGLMLLCPSLAQADPAVWVKRNGTRLFFSNTLSARIATMRNAGADIRFHFGRSNNPRTIASLEQAVAASRATLTMRLKRDVAPADPTLKRASVLIKWDDAKGKHHRIAQTVLLRINPDFVDLRPAQNARIGAFEQF